MRISDVYVTNKRAKQTQRRILKGFNINTVDGAIREAFASKNGNPSKDFFKTIAKAISSKKESKLSYANHLSLGCAALAGSLYKQFFVGGSHLNKKQPNVAFKSSVKSEKALAQPFLTARLGFTPRYSTTDHWIQESIK